MLNKTDTTILQTLTQARLNGKLLRVEDLARALGISAGLASQRLRRMEREGIVARTQKAVPEGRVVHYLPLPWASVRWSSPAEGIFLEWTAAGEIDWTLPLVSQIPDAEARETTRMFLGRLLEDGLLQPRKRFKPAWSKLQEADYSGLTLVVYGSTARSKARPGADVDMILFHREDRVERLARIQNHAAEVSLEAPRPIQLAVVDWRRRADQLPSRIRNSLKSDGLVVFDALRESDGQSIQIWRFVQGGGRGN